MPVALNNQFFLSTLCFNTFIFLVALECLRWLVHQTGHLMLALYTLQWYEFWRHATKNFIEHTFTIISLALILLSMIVRIYAIGCSIAGNPKEEIDDCFCNKLKNYSDSFSTELTEYVVETLLVLTPVWIFLLINTAYQSHDCYQCLNRSNTGKYSCFQYSKSEKRQRILEKGSRRDYFVFQ
jgi:hypothetical protein